jgi:hypothetical protein
MCPFKMFFLLLSLFFDGKMRWDDFGQYYMAVLQQIAIESIESSVCHETITVPVESLGRCKKKLHIFFSAIYRPLKINFCLKRIMYC